MSYILEALKKSDQQRQRSTTPTLPAAQAAAKTGEQIISATYVLIAVVLLCAGIAIGWLRPWQSAGTVLQTAGQSAILASPASAPEPLARNENPGEKLPVHNSVADPQVASGIGGAPTMIVAPGRSAVTGTSAATSVPMLKKTVASAVLPQAQNPVPLAELPLTIQQEIPAMSIQLHSFSSKPENSIVSINSRLLKEGESLTPGLKLEQITPDGVIFSYKGYRFERGIW